MACNVTPLRHCVTMLPRRQQEQRGGNTSAYLEVDLEDVWFWGSIGVSVVGRQYWRWVVNSGCVQYWAFFLSLLLAFKRNIRYEQKRVPPRNSHDGRPVR